MNRHRTLWACMLLMVLGAGLIRFLDPDGNANQFLLGYLVGAFTTCVAFWSLMLRLKKPVPIQYPSIAMLIMTPAESEAAKRETRDAAIHKSVTELQEKLD